ncbi:MAG TPA: magnesium transporter CorA family protein [Pseudonocardiaceae bacterium]|jgi:magnesium transporter|nr:magnesium transporter CorA family protein [Pseudonocardiaceae bacterium]
MDTDSGSATDRIARTRAYRGGELVAENYPVAKVSDYLADRDTVVWVDLCAPDTLDLKVVAEELGLHELAVEDAVERSQRPKLDHYSTHDFLSMYAVWLDRDSGQLETSELAAFITHRALVTVRKDERFDVQKVVDRWDSSGDLSRHQVGFLLYGLIDFVIDGHFQTVQDLDEEIEALEDLLFGDQPRDTDVQRRSFELRKSLVRLRRVVLPMREVVNTLMRRDVSVVAQEMIPYFQDVYDHVLRATEWTESLRDLVTTILETNITVQGNRLAVISKQVTSWAAIIAVPTAITGFYGQNIPYPGFGKVHGFIVSSALIVVLSVGLYMIFRRKGWL